MRTVQEHLIEQQSLRPTIDQEFDGLGDLDFQFLCEFIEFMYDKSDVSADIRLKAIEFFEKHEGEWYVLNNKQTQYYVYTLADINRCHKTKTFFNSLMKRNFEALENEFKRFRI